MVETPILGPNNYKCNMEGYQSQCTDQFWTGSRKARLWILTIHGARYGSTNFVDRELGSQTDGR